MLNIEKVKSMTKAAAYEKGPEKKNIEISSYYRTDYIGLQLVKSAMAYTVAFCILVGLWAIGRMEELMLMLSRAEDLQNIIKILVVLFVAGLVAYEGGVYAYYSAKYREAKKSLKGYDAHLRQIHKFYTIQESAGESNKNADGESTL